MRLFFRYAAQPATVGRALRVAFVVTPILTLLNHSQALWTLKLDGAFWLQAVLTFCVPYCVSTYSSAMTAIAEHRRVQDERAEPPHPGRGG